MIDFMIVMTMICSCFLFLSIAQFLIAMGIKFWSEVVKTVRRNRRIKAEMTKIEKEQLEKKLKEVSNIVKG